MTSSDIKSPPTPEFDQFSHHYEDSVDYPQLHLVGGATSKDFIRLKCEELVAILKSQGRDASQLSVLDAGCGTGVADEFLKDYFQSVIGVDYSSGMIDKAKSKNFPRCEFLVGDAAHIPLPDNSVDVVYSSCVFHHVDIKQHTQCLTEFKRVVRPGGTVAVFEHNPLNPVTSYLVKQCAIDRDAHLVTSMWLSRAYRAAGFSQIRSRFIIFFPRWMRWLLPLERMLSWFPLGGQYTVYGIKS